MLSEFCLSEKKKKWKQRQCSWDPNAELACGLYLGKVYTNPQGPGCTCTFQANGVSNTKYIHFPPETNSKENATLSNLLQGLENAHFSRPLPTEWSIWSRGLASHTVSMVWLNTLFAWVDVVVLWPGWSSQGRQERCDLGYLGWVLAWVAD